MRPLTPRESEVFALAGKGQNYGEIADSLGISLDTVKTYAQSILVKKDAHSMKEAILTTAHPSP